ncbi:MAG: metal-dependent transcriptional regulator [Saprospiraceae bacterium]|nr:metal-dependent transcriptional regulator [Saprospiraceae bacterium]
MTTRAEENYLKAILKIAEREKHAVTTNAISREIQTTAASVTDMLKRLAEKELVDYEKYRGVSLTERGRRLAIQLVRKHRLWEVFLVEHLEFGWDEVHDLAEELEHIGSATLINRLDDYLGNPKFDPHGDPIPNIDGKFTLRHQVPLAELTPGQHAQIVGVREHSTAFLTHLDEVGLVINSELLVLETFPYDHSLRIDLQGRQVVVSQKVARNIFVKPLNVDAHV